MKNTVSNIAKGCVALSETQAQLVLDYIVANKGHHVDGVDCEDDLTGEVCLVEHYCQESAVEDAARALGFIFDEQVADIENIVYRFVLEG